MAAAQAGTAARNAALDAAGRGARKNPFAAFAGLGTRVGFARGHEIAAEGAPATHCYRVVDGSVRLVKLVADGRRQVCEFLMPGDFIGLAVQERNYFAAEAVTDAVLVRYPRAAVEALIAATPALALAVRSMAAAELQRAYERMVLICRKTAHERTAWFLLEMLKRSAGGDSIVLPMTRSDIADYLGLVIETVSRVLTQLQHSGAIAIRDVNRIVVLDRDALETARGDA